MSHYRSGAMRQFLQNATQLQLFKQVPGLPSLACVWIPGGTGRGGGRFAAVSLSTEAAGLGGTPTAKEGLG